MEGSPDYRGHIEAAIEAILRPGEVTCEILAGNEMVIGASDRGLKGGDDGICPA